MKQLNFCHILRPKTTHCVADFPEGQVHQAGSGSRTGGNVPGSIGGGGSGLMRSGSSTGGALGPRPEGSGGSLGGFGGSGNIQGWSAASQSGSRRSYVAIPILSASKI